MLKYKANFALDPNLADFIPDYGQYETIIGKPLCDAIFRIVASVEGCNRLIGAIEAAPTKSPVPAIEHLLAGEIGDVAFENHAKKLTGRLVRQAIEHLGGRWVHSGAKAPGDSRYNRGSVYTFT